MPKKGHSKYLHFENAKNLIRKECIGSVAMYEKWYKHNKPNMVPRRPDIIYKKKGWKGWNDFLGNANKFAHIGKKQFVSWEECKRYARSTGAKTLAQWTEITKNGKKPANIPARPDYIYKEWFTWKDFLGTDFKRAIIESLDISTILFVIKLPDTPLNVFKINVTHGGKTSLIDAAKQGARVMASFEYTDPSVNWKGILSKYANNYYYGEDDDYILSNINGFLFELSNYLTVFKF